ncbi:MAG TPA: flagellar biosynthetic protein FliQ [Kofleriaceae bacterium]|nr:flagellar biosynthetic protein FliQ [Kofleriaceae bacterium]
MTASLVAIMREGVLLALLLAAPLLVAALVAGVLSGLLGAFTQIQDPAVSLVPRGAAVGVAIVVFAPAIAHQMEAFAARLWPLITAIGTG